MSAETPNRWDRCALAGDIRTSRDAADKKMVVNRGDYGRKHCLGEVTMIRCVDNLHYLKVTVTSISSPVNLEKRQKILHYEKQVSVLELLVVRDIHQLSDTYFCRFF